MRTAAFSGVLDNKGEFRLGVADMSVLEKLDSDYVREVISKEGAPAVLAIDSNLSPDAIASILALGHKAILEPISNEKLERIIKY